MSDSSEDYSLHKTGQGSENNETWLPKHLELPLTNSGASKIKTVMSDPGLKMPEFSTRKADRSCIYDCLPDNIENLRFQMLWNPSHFMRRQFGDLYSESSIGSVIVLTGTSLNAQATTCKEYLSRHWPETFSIVLDCLGDCMSDVNECTEGT